MEPGKEKRIEDEQEGGKERGTEDGRTGGSKGGRERETAREKERENEQLLDNSPSHRNISFHMAEIAPPFFVWHFNQL